MGRKLTTNEFIERAKLKHNNTYDYAKVKYLNVYKKVIITCKKHGDFLQNYILHVYRGAGCPKCARQQHGDKAKMSKNDFILKVMNIHRKYSYDDDVVLSDGMNTKIKVTCPKHGNFEVLAKSHLYDKHGCNQCRIESRRLTTEQFIAKARKLYGGLYDYSNTTYTRSIDVVDIICPEHGNIEITPNEHYRIGCFKCKRNRAQDKWLDEQGVPNDKASRQKRLYIEAVRDVGDPLVVVAYRRVARNARSAVK